MNNCNKTITILDPIISIIIVNYNAIKFIENLIESIIKYEDRINKEIIIINNDSTDENFESVNDYINIIFIKNKNNKGFAAANNIGAKLAKGKYLLFLNPDTLLLENSITKLINFREQIGKKCIVGPKLLNPDNSYQNSVHTYPKILDYLFVAFFLNSILKRNRFFNHFNYGWLSKNQTMNVDVIKGTCLLIDKEIYEKIGGMDENYFLFSEEIDLCYRAKIIGVDSIYYPETSIIHYGGQSTKVAKIKNFIELYKSMLIFMFKHKSQLYANVFKLVLIISTFNRTLHNYFIYILKRRKKYYLNKSKLFGYVFLWLTSRKSFRRNLNINLTNAK